MATNNEVGRVLALLATAFPRFELKKDTVSVYTQLLADLPTNLLEAAALRCATDLTFFPSVHELREAAVSLEAEAVGLPEVWEAWDNFVQVLKADYWMSGGKTIPGLFRHPLVEQTARRLGWPGCFPTDNLIADRAHFTQAYTEARRSAMRQATDIPAVRAYLEAAKENGHESLLPDRTTTL